MKKNRVLSMILCLGSAVIFLNCSESDSVSPQTGYTYQIPVSENDGWPTASLSDVGIDLAPLKTLMDNLLRDPDHFFHGILIIRDGKLVFEEYFNGYDLETDAQIAGSGQVIYTNKNFDRHTEHYQASAVKSFFSAWVGIAIDQGFIQTTDETLFSFFPDYSHLSNAENSTITIEHMLTMTSGLPWDDSSYPIHDPRNDEYQFLFNPDPIGYFLDRPMMGMPGTIFKYNSGTSYLLCKIVERSSGLSFADFADEYLFQPLGITEYRWGISNCDYDDLFPGALYLTPRNMAKFGQLYLQGGLWNNTRVLSEEWVTRSTQASVQLAPSQTPFSFVNGYGYQWWHGIFPAGNIETYFAAGWGGQCIFVMPEPGLIVVLTGGDFEGGTDYGIQYDVVNNFILSAVN